jgi:hypothetical protein
MLLQRSSAHAATTTSASVGANAVSVDLREACRRCSSCGSALPDSSGRRRPEVEHLGASDSNDSGPHQEGTLLTRGS